MHADIVAALDQSIEDQPEVLEFWGLRLEITPTGERAAVGERLRRAWRRGDVAAYQQADVTAHLVHYAPELAGPWIAQARPNWSVFAEVEKRAEWLKAVGQNREAAFYMAEARGKVLFARAEGAGGQASAPGWLGTSSAPAWI